MATAKDIQELNKKEDRCSCKHHWLTHQKRHPTLKIKKPNQGWCMLCNKWCKMDKIPEIYKGLKSS